LGVQPATDPKEIKERFYKLSKQYHPDLNKDDPSAMSKFKELVEAYETLSNIQEKSKYDEQHGLRQEQNGLRQEQKINIRRGKVVRNFHKGGLNEKGQYVDFDAPPVMRNIQYDLSPEKMQKIWERYKTRWEKIEEIERIRDLEKKKIAFRKKLDERRANMNNMSPEEKADLKFKLRMLRTDIDFNAENIASKHSYKSNIGYKFDKSSNKAKTDRPIHTSSNTKENVDKSSREDIKTSQTVNEESSDDYDWREEINRIKKQNEQFKEDKFGPFIHENRDGMFGKEEEEMFKDQKGRDSDHWNPREDPFLKGMNREDPASFKDWASKSYENSKETLHEMNRSQNPASMKHDINTQWEQRVTGRIFVVGIFAIFCMFFLNNINDNGFDNVEKVEKAQNK